MIEVKTPITRGDANSYIKVLADCLSDPAGALSVSTEKGWSKNFGNVPGVYTVFEGDKLIYVGESGGLRGRMKDLLSTYNHTLRRQLGTAQFGQLSEFKAATSSTKFPAEIEKLLNEFMAKRLTVKVVPVYLGRAEVEEKLIDDYKPKYNIKTRRGDLVEIVEG